MYERIKSMYKTIKKTATEIAVIGTLTGMALLPGCGGKIQQNPNTEAEPTSKLVAQIEELGHKFDVAQWYQSNLNNLVDVRIQGESGLRFPVSATKCLLRTSRDGQVTAFYSQEATRYRSERGEEAQKITGPAVAVSFHGKDITVHLIDTPPIDGRSIDAGVILQGEGLQRIARITDLAERQRLYDALVHQLIAYAQTQRTREAERKTETDKETQEREKQAINEAWRAIKSE